MQKQLKVKEQIHQLFEQKQCWTMDELCRSLGYAAISVRRFLKQIGYHSSFTHNSKWYTLISVPSFNKGGLWFYDSIGFSKHGNLKQTILYFINKSPQGLSAKELAEKLSVPCLAVLTHMHKSGMIDRFKSAKEFIYLCMDEKKKSHQLARLRSLVAEAPQPQSLSAQAAVYVLAEFIKNPQADYIELSRAAAQKQVIAAPEAIAQLFAEHDLKKTLN